MSVVCVCDVCVVCACVCVCDMCVLFAMCMYVCMYMCGVFVYKWVNIHEDVCRDRQLLNLVELVLR